MTKRFWYGINKETNPFGFGCWQIAGKHTYNNRPHGWGNISEAEAIELLCLAMESGIEFFDTAQGYNYGKSEQLLGKAIKITGKDIVLCTKIPLEEEEITTKKIGSEFENRVQLSLSNLGLNYIDILLIHNPPDDIDWKNFNYEILDHLVEKKIIGTYGVSSKGLQGAKNAIQNNVGNTLEWVFNILERRPIQELFPEIEEKKLNFIARSPLSRGLINPRYLKVFPKFDNEDFRINLPAEWMEWTSKSLSAFHLNGCNENEIIKNALFFCLQFKQVNSLILGIKTRQQLDDYLNISQSVHSGFDFNLLHNLPEFYPKWA